MTNNNSRNVTPNLMHTTKSYTNFTNQTNPFGNFQPRTNNLNKTFGDYEKAFSNHNPVINRQDYRNQYNTLHNNLQDNLINEHITEYRINIDSIDRDITAYPNPFDFTVTFAPPSRQAIKEKVYINPDDPSKGKTIKTTYINGAPEPSINREFKNVKFVKIESIILPKYNRIIKTPIANEPSEPIEFEYFIDGNNSIDSDRFVILNIPELRNFNTFGTNTALENGFILYTDRQYETFYSGLSYYSSRTFDDNALGNITRLNFKLKTSRGEQLKLGIYDKDGNQLNEQLDTNIINSANPNNIWNRLFQINISLVIGVVENNLNTITKYD